MLNEYLPNDLMSSEVIKRDWFLNNCTIDQKYFGGDIIVPFVANNATSVKFGGLTSASDIHKHAYVRGKITGYKEVWASMAFDHRDILDHAGKVKEDTFLKMLPGQLEDHVQHLKMVLSNNLMSGPHFAKVTDSTDAATGIFVVDKIDRFELGMKAYIMDANSNETVVYVINVNIDDSKVTLSASRGGVAANLSAYTAAQYAKLYFDGIINTSTHAVANAFTSLKGALLSAANGGDASIHGQTKTAYPYLQAVNISGSTISASNIMDKIFDAFTTFRAKAKGANVKFIVMSYKHLGSVMKAIEVQKGGNKVSAGQTRVNQYGWTEIDITGVKGVLTVVGVQEMDDDIIFGLDMNSFVFRTNGFIRKRTAPDGKQYYEVRDDTNGYYYILDHIVFGELEVTKPSNNFVIHSIPAYS
jgi:hypothetical protein